MATSPEELRRLYEPLAKHVKTLLNNDLKSICRTEGLPVTGVKAALQARVLNRLDEAVTSGDAVRFREVANKIKPQPLIPLNSTSHSYPLMTAHPKNTNFIPCSHRSLNAGAYSNTPQGLSFTESPFYQIVGPPLTSPTLLPPMSSNRNTVRTVVTLSTEQAATIRDNKSMKIMLYCAADDSAHNSGRHDIAFPSQIEVKVNGDIFAGSLRGIKKKSGTTRPADITSLIRAMPHCANEVSITYAVTEKNFTFVVLLVRECSVDELVERIKRGHVIPAQLVIDEMLGKAADPDIVTTSTIMSLKCPLSYLRIELPCRSSICKHNQCFDAASFLQVQQQAPQWTCPICNKVFRFENLAVDKYVQGILQKTSRSTEQILIEPNGTWRSAEEANRQSQDVGTMKRKAEILDGDSDFLEVSNKQVEAQNVNVDRLQRSSVAPSLPFRDPKAPGLSFKKAKRATEEVIDLTLSSDEDTSPVPAVKRQSLINHGLYQLGFDGMQHAHATPIGSSPHSRVSFGIPGSQITPTTLHRRPADEQRFYSDWTG